MPVEISNEQNGVEVTPALISYIEQAAKLALELTGGDPAGEFSLVLVDDQHIHELNRDYRGKDCPTDVLSFAMLETSEDEPVVLGLDEDHMLGDIFVSLETATRQAADYGHTLDREIVYLCVHGMLHLLGYDHLEDADKVRMREKEEQVMAELDLRREAE
ncbi:MAG TPA: rRNA maturation RNase YbeY [Candidatus Deferrimicrobium sp.]|nr:rRNA maturation RNase YbeY [Candidatus Deferrimicrobium sp.]